MAITLEIVVLVISVSLLFAVAWVCEQKKWAQFNERYPPMTDPEFIQRCSPGTDPEVAIKIRHILSDSLGIPVERIYPDQNFSDLGVD